MIEFEEAGGEYELEKAKKGNSATKVRVVTLFLAFALVIIFLIKNDFDFNFIKTQAAVFETTCQGSDEYSNRHYDELKLEKAQAVLDQNISNLETIKSFHKGYVALEPIGYQGRRTPVIKLEFKGTVDLDKKIPEKICGFKVSVAYK